MTRIFQSLIKFVILICVIVGLAIIYKSREDKKAEQAQYHNSKALILKKFLIGFNKPRRIEVFNYTKRFDTDVKEIKQMKVPLDDNSDFYITIQFFTDESDLDAPLVAQIRFMNVKSDNMVKEESINLQ